MMQSFTHDGQEMKYQMLGASDSETAVIWAHGWGTSHADFLPIAKSVETLAFHYVIDFPGFGDSPAPRNVWAPKEYGDYLASFVKSLPQKNILWVGHSFGCRVGVNIGAHHPNLINAMILVAAAGLPRQRSPLKKLHMFFRVRFYKLCKKLVRFGLISESWVKSRFGSADYKNAGDMRDILVKTIHENLRDVATQITCPVTLVYGDKDDSTPISMGKMYNALIPNSELIVLDRLDHYSILKQGRHQIATRLKSIIKGE